jgi:hypothetical protein
MSSRGRLTLVLTCGLALLVAGCAAETDPGDPGEGKADIGADAGPDEIRTADYVMTADRKDGVLSLLWLTPGTVEFRLTLADLARGELVDLAGDSIPLQPDGSAHYQAEGCSLALYIAPEQVDVVQDGLCGDGDVKVSFAGRYLRKP